jgi:glycosyltransferase involved in cell wall biosynthesis
MSDLSVVIPTYNRLSTLEQVIPALLESDLEPNRYELLVCDSNSNDGTAEFLAKLAAKHPQLRHLPGPYNGRAQARNAGINAAHSPIVLFTDADIIPSPDLLRRHVERHAQFALAGKRDVAVVGMELQVSSLSEYRRLRDYPSERRPLHPKWRRKVDWLFFLTGNASVRRDDLVRLGGFDEEFTGYGHEDLELGFRLARSGIRLVYEPKAINFHWHPVPYGEQRGRMELAGRSTVRFVLKHRSMEARLKLGMSPLNFGLHNILDRFPKLRERLERAGEHKKLPRELIYQYHYVSGMKSAIRDARKKRNEGEK